MCDWSNSVLFDMHAKHHYRVQGGNGIVALIYIAIYTNKFMKNVLYILGYHLKNSRYTYLKKSYRYISFITIHSFTNQVGAFMLLQQEEIRCMFSTWRVNFSVLQGCPTIWLTQLTLGVPSDLFGELFILYKYLSCQHIHRT